MSWEDDFEKQLEEKRRKKEEERLAFLNKCLTKLTDPELAYRCLALRIAERFEIESNWSRQFPGPVYAILNHYVNEVDEDFETWLNKEDAPFIRKAEELDKIFPEFTFESSNRKKVELINKVYNVSLIYYHDEFEPDYIYSYSFDFNSFKPLDINKIHLIKGEIRILEKYNHPTLELEEQLKEFNLPEDILKEI